MILAALLAAGLAAAAAPAPAPAPARPAYGVLLLAHGGGEAWNREISKIAETIAQKAPVEIAFGMADADSIESALQRLEASNPAKIVAVPLFINSSSEVLDETRWVLGLAERPSEVFRRAMERLPAHHGGHGAHAGHGGGGPRRRVKSRAPLAMTQALDDHPFVAEILLDRARAMSRDPGREIIILVGHGPVDEKANIAWTRTLKALASGLEQQGRFRSVAGATLRDDAPAAVRGQAVKGLREMVGRAAVEGRVIVLPYLISAGGIEHKVAEALKGLKYAWDGRALCPHPNMARWVAETAAAGARLDDMRRFK